MQIAAYQGTSFISRAIRWQTRSLYSHVGILFDTALIVNGRTVPSGSIFEAWQVGGVKLNPTISAVHSTKTKVDLFAWAIPLTEQQEQDVAKWLFGQEGKKYDFHSVLRFLDRSKQGKNDSEKWFCSELCGEALASINRPLQIAASWQLSPRDVAISPALVKFQTVVTL